MKQEFVDKFNTLNKLQSNDKQLKQQRGRDFEDLINDILSDEGILLKKSFHTYDNKSEQIDGAIEINNRIFLIETKWVTSNLAASDLFSFIGKIENKFFGTLGVFISREKLSENFINSLNKGRRQSVIVIHGDDIDKIFNMNSNVNFNEYISHSLKVCSYDNVLHFPVEKFIEISKDKSKNELENLEGDAFDFIRKYLWKNQISEEDLLFTIEGNNKALNSKIFKILVTKYSDIYNINHQNFDFTIIENFNKFLKLFTPDKVILNQISDEYFTKLIFKNFAIYHRDIFSNLFSEFYHNISLNEKETIETKLSKKLESAVKNSDWNLENYITDIIRPIWKDIEGKDKFKEYYLPIYLRDTLDKFSQKEFANELVYKGEIDLEFSENWLKRKIKNIYLEYNKNIDENDIKFVARTYIPLNKILNKEIWTEYITSLFNNIS